MRTTCVVATDINQVEVGEYELREPQPGEVLVETLYSTISPGTELRCLRAGQPEATFPMVTGYSLAGKVLRGAGDLRAGDHVFVKGTGAMPEGVASLWGGHIGHAIVPAEAALKLPPTIDPRTASALAMLTISLHGVLKCRPEVGERVLVAGLGLIGQVAAALFRLAGCQVAVCDPVESRRAIAAPDGKFAYAPGPDWHEAARRDFPEGFDTVMDCTGLPAVVTANLPLLRAKSYDDLYEPSPKLALLASYEGDIALDYHPTIFDKETELVTCRGYLPHEFERMVRLLETGALELGPILSTVMPVSEAPEGFRRLREHPEDLLTITFDWAHP